MNDKAPEVKVPALIKPGEDFLIRTKAWHPMETGWRKDHEGKTVPRNRIRTFTCTFNGQEVVTSDWHSGVSENPYFTFHARVPGAGTFEFAWVADDGTTYRQSATVAVASA
ncbi:thiosulfate oxidation carrier complex protein SoxZ [Magnetospira sp. QH-2]|uniref:thiosulfate oxidation carrier complex protein SoxZ n=1 Tax=Magnetospira sp. (strain QH-2) TaxID=1288970 RepID=UPI0003E813C6|nr:thiosulfate oxidation carrier complex protein SoxZ [Magnetospira sp. QH-2]CCQ74019.1 Putative sulfur oxidation protein (soxZ) [Magnetospira sp. QH-2]